MNELEITRPTFEEDNIVYEWQWTYRFDNGLYGMTSKYHASPEEFLKGYLSSVNLVSKFVPSKRIRK